MARLTYTPDEDVKVHEEGAIRLICKAFQSHENGLPEWLKNSADAYIREDASKTKRIIVVLFDYGRTGATPSISCLDFAGMTSTMIEQNFRIWADPEAATRGARNPAVQGGHGNGGKCYMTQMFEDYALIHTVKRGRGNRYGVLAGSVKFGYIPNRAQGRNFLVTDLAADLGQSLSEIGSALRALPQAAHNALEEADGFTLTTGVNPRGYGNKIPIRTLIASLEEHPQMIRTLELCSVYVIMNGKAWNGGRPLALPEIQPMEEATEPRVITIPKLLKDPLSEEKVSTTGDDSVPLGTLTLRTSRVSMRYGKKGRHNIIYKAQSGYIGYVPVLELDVQSSYRDRIYGECQLQALEALKKNERSRLADSPLTRAVERFISHQVETYCKEFEAREKRRYNQEEKDAISKINEALDQWKNRFLNELMRGLWGPGIGPPIPPRSEPLPVGKPAKLELTLTHSRAGVGVAFKPSLKFFDASSRRIRPVPFRWFSEDTNIAIVDEDLMVINTFTPGRTIIYAETLDGRLDSNKVPLEVVAIRGIQIVPSEVKMTVGSRQKLEAICRLADGNETRSVYLEWLESNPNIAKVSAAGLVFGFSPGETEVRAGDDLCLATEPAVVRVSADQGRGKGDQRGRGLPVVLVSGEIDLDPETHEYVHFSSDDPPVAQRPQDFDRKIWWINSAAPLARLYLDKSKGYGFESREWRMYHLERYIDVIVQIALTHGPTETESLSAGEWILRWGGKVAEIQAAAATDLSEFIASGQLPTA